MLLKYDTHGLEQGAGREERLKWKLLSPEKHLQYMKPLLTSRALSTTSAFNGLAIELLLVLVTFFASEDDMLS